MKVWQGWGGFVYVLIVVIIVGSHGVGSESTSTTVDGSTSTTVDASTSTTGVTSTVAETTTTTTTTTTTPTTTTTEEPTEAPVTEKEEKVKKAAAIAGGVIALLVVLGVVFVILAACGGILGYFFIRGGQIKIQKPEINENGNSNTATQTKKGREILIFPPPCHVPADQEPDPQRINLPF